MRLLRRIEKLEKASGNVTGMRLPTDFVLTPQEHAAFCLSATPFFASYDAEYTAKAGLFLRQYGGFKHVQQTDPAEMMRAMRNTVHGDDAGRAAERQRYRSLMDSVFQRCGFDSTAGSEGGE